MRSVVQRVKSARVEIDGKIVGSIGKGFLVLLGVCDDDTEHDMAWLADKIAGLRVFDDENDKMNLALADVGGGVLVVSQFTLYGDCKKGKRPNFTGAGKPDFAKKMYLEFVEYLRGRLDVVETGEFGADMLVSLENDGPVTLIIDSKE